MKNNADKTYKVVINESCHGELVLSPMAVEWLKQHDFEYRVKGQGTLGVSGRRQLSYSPSSSPSCGMYRDAWRESCWAD